MQLRWVKKLEKNKKSHGEIAGNIFGCLLRTELTKDNSENKSSE